MSPTPKATAPSDRSMMREHLAALWGVQTTYEDYRKKHQVVPVTTVDTIMEIMEADASGPRPGPAIVVRQGHSVELENVVSIETEDGGSARMEGVALPPDLPVGYHRVRTGSDEERPLIVSPGSCYLPPDLSTWGWAVQLYSLRSSTSWGIGDLSDLRRLAGWARTLGATEIMLNPLHAPLPVTGQQPSPYFPSSRCFRNPIYIGVEELAAAQGAELDDLIAEGRALNETPTIDRDAAYKTKMHALRRLWEAGAGSDADTARSTDELLRSYAIFAAAAEHYDAGPDGWPRELARGDKDELDRWAAKHDDRVRFHGWLQGLLDRQLESAGREVGLVNDLAIGVDPQGADAWLWKDAFASGATVGAPPDEFNLRGQGWGLPPFDPWKLRSMGYEPFIQTIRSAFRYSAGMRIDHVMGLFRLYWIPDGCGPEDGTYVRYPHEDLLNIVALESHRAQAYVVGEDLGTVEDAVRDEMSERNMLSYRLLWFEEQKPENYPSLALAAVANHDVPTIAGLWSGSDVDAQKAVGLEVNDEGIEAQLERLRGWLDLGEDASLDEVILAMYQLLAVAPSAVIMATLEDVLGVEERPNMPGTLDERPNWSIPLPLTLEELTKDPRVLRVAALLSAKRSVKRTAS